MATITQQKVKPATLTSERFRITIVASVAPGRAELLSSLEAASWANARWFLAMHDAGLEAPCCLGCAGMRYDPDRLAVDVRFATGDELVNRGHGSCGELVAFDVGRLRADAIRAGKSVEAARDLAWPVLTAEPAPRGAEKWHAMERIGTALVDISASVPRATAPIRGTAPPCNCGGPHG